MNRARPHDPRQDAAWLAAALREQADEHEADLARINSGLQRQIADAPRGAERRRWRSPLRLRLIGVPLGVVTAVATATIAAGVTLGIADRPTHPARQAAASSSPSQPAADRQPTPPAASTTALHPAGTASARSESTPSRSAGPLAAVGSVDSLTSSQYWAQEDLTVTTTSAVSALHVTVAVSGGAAVQSTGSWSTILSANIDTSVSRTPGGLTYDFTLHAGQTLQPGSYAFGFQFDRPASGHSFTLDTYTVTVTTAEGSQQASVHGTFAG
jgi:hypothetical protein